MIRARITSSPAARLRAHATSTAPAARVALASALFDRTKADVVATTPVDTGRLRRGWSDALTQAADEGSASRRSAANPVPYAPYIEYGTRRTAPRRVVRNALARAAAAAAGLFRLGGPSLNETPDAPADDPRQ